MKKYIIGILIVVFLIAGCFYLVFSRDENLTITYIKFKVNPEFVVGINSNNKVVMYNPLNEEAKIFNLGMFRNKTIEEMCNIFIDKITENNYLTTNDINVTIMTKNLEKREQFFQIVSSAINDNKQVIVNVLEPTDEELLSYSNEVVFDLETTYQNEDLIRISKDIKGQIKEYMDNKINALNINKLNFEQQKEIIENNYALGYFDDFNISDIALDDEIIISNRSNYNIEFYFNEDFTYSYNIILNIEFDYYSEITVDDKREGTVEVYEYTYDINNVEVISNYKNHFYKFNY